MLFKEKSCVEDFLSQKYDFLLNKDRKIEFGKFILRKINIYSFFNLKKNSDGSSSSVSILLVKAIVSELEYHFKIAKSSLLKAALTAPIYGPLSAIRNLINHSFEE